MVGVQVGQEDSLDILPFDSELGQALQGTASGIEDKLLVSGLDQGAWPKAVHNCWRTAGAKERHPKVTILGGCGSN
jgi:hypothetical protein